MNCCTLCISFCSQPRQTPQAIYLHQEVEEEVCREPIYSVDFISLHRGKVPEVFELNGVLVQVLILFDLCNTVQEARLKTVPLKT